jgi:hypothetical protein
VRDHAHGFDGSDGAAQTFPVPRPSRCLLSLSLTVFLASALAACGDDGPHFVPASANRGQNLMVIDEGFDVTAAEFSNKLVATYTFACAGGSGDSTDGDGGGPLGIEGLSTGSLTDQKQQILSELAKRDDSCHLLPGISHKTDPLASVARFKARWNAALKSNQPYDTAFTVAEWQVLQPALNKALTEFPFHGTATAGTAAHENDDLRLVLVERPLGDASAVMATFTCVAQADLDRFTALYSDPDVVTAYANQPEPTLDADLDHAMAIHAVGLVNESYGSSTRLFLEQLQDMAGCGTTDFTGYFTALGNLDLAQRRAGETTGSATLPLTVQAAGNDGAQIDSVTDSLDCDLGDPLNLAVGSLALDGTVSTFSNHGACVDLYAPGESVITPVAGGWYFAVDGTSFSSPLAARTLALAAAASTTTFDPAQARQQLLAQNAGNGEQLLPAAFPSDLFYQPASAAQALTAGAARGMTHWQPPARIDLRKMLGPLTRRRRGIP